MKHRGSTLSSPLESIAERAGVASVGRLGCGAVVFLLFALGACDAPTGEKSSTSVPSTQPSRGRSAVQLIQSQPMAHKDGTVKVDLLSVDRSAADTVTVRWRLNNDGPQVLDPAGSMEQPEFHPVSDVDGVSLVDLLAHRRYFPLKTGSGACICSDASARIDPGKGSDFYAVFPAPPSGLRRITVAVPLTPAFLDIPIGHSPRAFGSDEVDPSKTQVKTPPQIEPLISTIEGVDESVDEDADNTSVRLSADVLFAVGKADLSPRAQSVLQNVAKQIDASPGNTVKVDGYTDSTGNDAINNPLSQRRAQAVETALRSLVTRASVTYQSAGHGSQNPVADNGTAGGRQKNRRVTVTFARPTPTPTQQAPSQLRPGKRGPGANCPWSPLRSPSPSLIVSTRRT